MDCVSKYCKGSDEDRMVSCWLCLGNCHLKCSGLRARDADALADNSKYLQWTCPNCRIVGVEFYNFFRSYKEQFDDIKNSFLALQSKLDKYGELFSNFKNLENFVTSPKPKNKPMVKQSSNSNSPGNSKKQSKPKKIIIPSTIDSPRAPLDIVQNSLSLSPAVIIDETSVIPASNDNLNQPKQLPISGQIINSVCNKSSNNNSPELMVFSPNLHSNSELIENPTTSCQSNRAIQINHNPTKPKPLRVIPLLKTIFTSRFAPDTTVLDVEYFIKNKISKNFHNDIQIFKINSGNRASFKIIVPEIIFDQLEDLNFWPKNTIVRQFIYKSNSNVTLPNVIENRKKNHQTSTIYHPRIIL